VERDNGPPTEGAASFHTTRWTILMRTAQSQAQGGQVELYRLYWYRFLRERVSRTVSDPGKVDEEIRALCEAIIASEARAGP
jgi:hypothetical protein